jgi:membrane-associated phospholipid phosphatase
MFPDRRSNLLVFGVLPLVSLLCYFLVDRPVARLCAAIPDAAHDVLDPITDLGRSEWYLAGGLLAVLALRFALRRPRLLTAAVLLVASVALSGIAVNVLKLLVGRSRPYNLLRHEEYGFVPLKIDYAYNAFPSGHTATVVAVVLSLSFAFPRWRAPLFVVGAIVVSTRILMNHHFVSDVIMGGVLATAITLATARWAERRTWGLGDRVADRDAWPARSLPGAPRAGDPPRRHPAAW